MQEYNGITWRGFECYINIDGREIECSTDEEALDMLNDDVE